MRSALLAAAAVAVTCAVAGCTPADEPRDARAGGSNARPSPSGSLDAAPRTREAWSRQMSEICRQQAALTPSLALAPRATPDDVELGIRQLAEAAAAVAPPPGDTEVASARARLNDAAGTWLALAEAVSTSAAGREVGTEQIRAAVAALAAAGAGDCDRLLPRRSG